MVAEANNNEFRNRKRPHDQPDISSEHTVEIPYQEGSIIISFSPEWGRSNLPLQNVFGTQGANRLGLPPSVMLSNRKGINPMAQQMLNRPELHAGVDAHEEMGQRDYRLRALQNAGITVSQTEDATYIHISRIPPNQWVQINGQKYYGPIGNGYGTETNIPTRGIPVRNETGRQTGEQNSEGRDIRLVQENGPEGFFASVESNVSSRSQVAEETAQRHVRVLGGAPGRFEQGQFAGQGMPPQMEGRQGIEGRITRLEPALVQEIKLLPEEYHGRVTQFAEQMTVPERAVLVTLLQKLQANIMPLSHILTPDGRLRQANEPGLSQPASRFLSLLSPQERTLYERIVGLPITQGGRIEFQGILPESYPLKKDSPDVQKKIEKSLKRYHDAPTQEDKLIAEGILRMQGVHVEVSDLGDSKKIKMYPRESSQRFWGFVLGLIQVCVGIYEKNEGKKTKIDTKPDTPEKNSSEMTAEECKAGIEKNKERSSKLGTELKELETKKENEKDSVVKLEIGIKIEKVKAERARLEEAIKAMEKRIVALEATEGSSGTPVGPEKPPAEPPSAEKPKPAEPSPTVPPTTPPPVPPSTPEKPTESEKPEASETPTEYRTTGGQVLKELTAEQYRYIKQAENSGILIKKNEKGGAMSLWYSVLVYKGKETEVMSHYREAHKGHNKALVEKIRKLLEQSEQKIEIGIDLPEQTETAPERIYKTKGGEEFYDLTPDQRKIISEAEAEGIDFKKPVGSPRSFTGDTIIVFPGRQEKKIETHFSEGDHHVHNKKIVELLIRQTILDPETGKLTTRVVFGKIEDYNGATSIVIGFHKGKREAALDVCRRIGLEGVIPETEFGTRLAIRRSKTLTAEGLKVLGDHPDIFSFVEPRLARRARLD